MAVNHYPEDRRYMSHEARAAEDPRYRGKVEAKAAKVAEVCYCGKTVIRPGVECPRNCEANRPH